MLASVLLMVNLDTLKLDAQLVADKTAAAIERTFWDPKRKLYIEAVDKPQPAFNWGVGVMLSALNATNNEARIEEWWPVMQSYWQPEGPVPGYDVLPMPKSQDRFYDDNAWMAIALFDAGKKYWGIQATRYALSGLDDKLGGGVYWREKEKTSKNTCSNSPTAYAAYRAWHLTTDRGFRYRAEAILNWTLKHLMDPEDLLMWDNIRLNGEVEKTKWSYNTALTIRCLAESERLGFKHEVTARQMWDSAWKHWKVKSGIACEGKFAHLLVEAGLAEGFLSDADKHFVIDLLKRHGEKTGWLFGNRWDRLPGPKHKAALIDAASALRVAGLLVRACK